MADKILAEVKAFESREIFRGAGSGEFTYVAAVKILPKFKCPSCRNKVGVLSYNGEDCALVTSVLRQYFQHAHFIPIVHVGKRSVC